MNATEISPSEYMPFYEGYIKQAGSIDLITGIEKAFESTLRFYQSISDEKMECRYVEGKWTIKDIIQHHIDAERVFAYRALRFAREDKTELPGFEENSYANSSRGNSRSKDSLIEEYQAVRNSTLSLFKSFDDDVLLRIGVASGGEMSVRATSFIIIGHEAHHCNVIKERYLD